MGWRSNQYDSSSCRVGLNGGTRLLVDRDSVLEIVDTVRELLTDRDRAKTTAAGHSNDGLRLWIKFLQTVVFFLGDALATEARGSAERGYPAVGRRNGVCRCGTISLATRRRYRHGHRWIAGLISAGISASDKLTQAYVAFAF